MKQTLQPMLMLPASTEKCFQLQQVQFATEVAEMPAFGDASSPLLNF